MNPLKNSDLSLRTNESIVGVFSFDQPQSSNVDKAKGRYIFMKEIPLTQGKVALVDDSGRGSQYRIRETDLNRFIEHKIKP